MSPNECSAGIQTYERCDLINVSGNAERYVTLRAYEVIKAELTAANARIKELEKDAAQQPKWVKASGPTTLTAIGVGKGYAPARYGDDGELYLFDLPEVPK